MTDGPARLPGRTAPTYAYTPGDWTVLARGGMLAAVPHGTDETTVQALWEAMDGDDAGVATLLPLLSGGFGAGLAAMPPFAVAAMTSGLHVILRGAVRLTVTGPTGSTTFTGERVTTWTEHLLDEGSFSSFALTCGPSAGSAQSLPLAVGAVLASSVTAQADADDATELPTVSRVSSGAKATPDGTSGGTLSATPDVTTDPTPDALVAEPGSLGAMDPELEAEPSLAVGERDSDGVRDVDGVRPGAAGSAEADDSATINPGLYLTSVPADVADPGVVSAVEPLAPVTDAPPVRPQGHDSTGADATDGLQGHDAAARGQERDLVQDDGSSGNGFAPDVEEDGTSGIGYDHLWDQTVARRVEDAAVREADDAPTVGSTPRPSVAGPSMPGAVAAPALKPDAKNPGKPAPETSAQSQAQAPAEPAATPPAVLIDSVPWSTGRSTETAAPEPAGSASLAPRVPASAPPAPAASAPSTPPLSSTPSAAPILGDHDGQTVMRSQLPEARVAPERPVSPAPAERAAGTGPLVLARLCVAGHANAPTSSACSICGGTLQDETQQVPRPGLGVMRISTGEVVDLDRSIIVGRQPSVSRVQGREMPKLVQVQSASGDISRSHVEVRLDGWHVMLCDLKATNGTVLIRDGQPPRRLGQGETAFLLDGDIAQLGDDVSLRFEDLP